MKKISFDFDSTLDRQVIQDFAFSLIKKGYEVWVCTSRFDDESAPRPKWNDDLYLVTDKLGIPRERIQFMNMNDKYEFFKNSGFTWHLDDDWAELNYINTETDVKGISCFGNKNWKQQCKDLL